MKKIYLQTEEDSEDDEWEGRTWCEDRINNDDVEYIRSDINAELKKQFKALYDIACECVADERNFDTILKATVKDLQNFIDQIDKAKIFDK